MDGDYTSLEGSPVESQPTDTKEVTTAMSSSVKKWNARIRAARGHWEKDFERMQKNADFCGGWQWGDQREMNDDRYKNNVTLKLVQQKVAALYAKDPRVKAQRIRRMDFQLWDGRMESLQQAVALSAVPEADPADILVARALLADYTRGRQQRDMIDKVGQTLEHLLTYYLKNQTPEFKTQLKQTVRRAVITGVGYVRVDFAREHQQVLNTTTSTLSLEERINRADEIVGRLKRGELTMDSPEVIDLATLFNSVAADTDIETGDIDERLVFDFPTSTSIIIDPQCRSLKGFVGAKWIAEEYLMPLSDVNAFFKTNISYGSGANSSIVQYSSTGIPTSESASSTEEGQTETCLVCLWEVFDQRTKSSFFILDGYDRYLQEPTPVWPQTKHFWPIHALTFNEVEVIPGKTKASIFPPSDIDLLRDAQKEINRSRQDLKDHRIANRPKYAVKKGMLTDKDIDNLIYSAPHSVVQLEGALPDQKIADVFTPIVHTPVDPMLYDTAPQNQDIMAVSGNEEATVPAAADTTATAATINEQSRLVATGSNIDDLDDFLSALVEASGEILIREMSAETVMRIVGEGAVWPQIDQDQFVNYIYLEVMASSSGRPNRALEIANFTQLAPILMQAGASTHFIAREAIKRLDDRLDPDEIFTFGAGQAAVAMPFNGQQQQNGGSSSGEPARGQARPTPEGQNPAATVPKPKTERPVINQ
jgi:hypothetical protein